MPPTEGFTKEQLARLEQMTRDADEVTMTMTVWMMAVQRARDAEEDVRRAAEKKAARRAEKAAKQAARQAEQPHGQRGARTLWNWLVCRNDDALD
jgi:hypothetical protein